MNLLPINMNHRHPNEHARYHNHSMHWGLWVAAVLFFMAWIITSIRLNQLEETIWAEAQFTNMIENRLSYTEEVLIQHLHEHTND